MFQLQRMRQLANMTQKDVAAVLGISAKGYYKWEHEERDISLRDAITLADLFHCSLDELAGRTPPTSAILNDDERTLIDAYRSTDARGRGTIAAVAQSQRGDALFRSARSA